MVLRSTTHLLCLALLMGNSLMALSIGQNAKPAAKFSNQWETKLRPNFPASKPVPKLKDMHLRTTLATADTPQAILLVPTRYQELAEGIQQEIQQATGNLVPIVPCDQDTDPETPLATSHVITFGNMATNPFVFRLYCQYLTLLDLKWPGAGGHALLSLHNPYGTGHNTILIGGSDDAGVAESARLLAREIQRTKGVLGRLHDVGLPPDTKVPEPWRGDKVAYWPGTPGTVGQINSRNCFGWNSIATYAALYYMTGRPVYAEHFKRLAMATPERIPEEHRTDYSYWNPGNPLVETYHYYSPLIPYLWGLIEESPVFTDADRLFITNKLIEQQDHYDPTDAFAVPNGSRHGSYQMLNIFTGSLYLAKYYPEARWHQRLANIRTAFAAWKTSVTWGELDLIPWLPTSQEFVLNFFLLDDSWRQFVDCGAAAELIAPQLHCWTGTPRDSVAQQQALSMMHKAAWVLQEPGYVWLARQAPYDLGLFRIGQSWWPNEKLAPKPPTWAVDRVSNVPLQKTYWERLNKPIPLEQGSQYLVYRDSLDDQGDYLRLDVSWFCDRTPYHLATPDLLRIAGKKLISGLGSLLIVRRQGLLETKRTPQVAAVTGKAGARGGAALSMLVPQMSYGSWRRTVLHRTGRQTVCVDEVVPTAAGELEISADWKIAGPASVQQQDGIGSARSATVELLCAGVDELTAVDGIPRLLAHGDLKAGQPRRLLTILAPAGKTHRRLGRLGPQVYGLDGEALVITGPARWGDLGVKAAALYLDRGTLLAAELTHLQLGEWQFVSDVPCALVWDLVTGAVRIDVPRPATLRIGTDKKQLGKGEHDLSLLHGSAFATLIANIPALPDQPIAKPTTDPVALNLHRATWVREGDLDCLRFAANDHWASTGGDVLPQAKAFTVAAWVRPERFIAKEESARTKISCQAIAAKWSVPDNRRNWMLLLVHRSLGFWASSDGGLTQVKRAGHPQQLEPGWTHVAAVYDQGTVTLYVNGVPGKPVVVGPIADAGGVLTLGRYQSGYPFRGLQHGVHLYDRALPADVLGTHAKAGPGSDLVTDATPVFAPAPLNAPPQAIGGDWQPQWLRHAPGEVRHLAITPDQDIWVACANGLLLGLHRDGAAQRVLHFPAEITSLCAAPDAETQQEVAVLVGLDNDEVHGLDATGKRLWQGKAEVHPTYWLKGHWRAPWFTDPKNCHGVLALRFIRWQADAPAEIALGRACTVELRRLDGSLRERVAVNWGDRATLAEGVVKDGSPMLVAGNWFRCLRADMQQITAKGQTAGGVYNRLPADYTRIPGHGQGFRFPVLADLEGDGQQDFAAALCGTWNDLTVYDAQSQAPKWTRVMGPWSRGARSLISGLSAGSLGQGNTQALAATARNGWVWLFAPDGALLWATRPGPSAECVQIARKQVAVGFANGHLRAYDAEGKVQRWASLPGQVTHLLKTSDGVVVGTSTGRVVSFPASNAPTATPRTEKAVHVAYNGRQTIAQPLPAEDGLRLQLFPVQEGDGVYAGKAEVAFTGPGKASFRLGTR